MPRLARAMQQLFHKDIGFPEALVKQLPKGKHRIILTRHAAHACQDDRYGEIPIPEAINYDGVEFIELESTRGKLTKGVVRGRLDDERDTVLVMRHHRPSGLHLCVTTWINLRSDQHNTLRRGVYKMPQQFRGTP